MYSDAYERQIGDPRSSLARKVDQFYIRLLINPTYYPIDDCDSVFCDSSGRRGPPYTLVIGTSYYGETADAVAIHEALLQRGSGAPIALHRADDEPLRLFFEPWLDHAVKANHLVPLGENLPFVAGEDVIVTVRFQPPESSEVHTITTVFRGTTERVSRSKFMTVLQGS